MYHVFFIHSSFDAHLNVASMSWLLWTLWCFHLFRYANYGFLPIYAQEWDCWILVLFFFFPSSLNLSKPSSSAIQCSLYRLPNLGFMIRVSTFLSPFKFLALFPSSFTSIEKLWIILCLTSTCLNLDCDIATENNVMIEVTLNWSSSALTGPSASLN